MFNRGQFKIGNLTTSEAQTGDSQFLPTTWRNQALREHASFVARSSATTSQPIPQGVGQEVPLYPDGSLVVRRIDGNDLVILNSVTRNRISRIELSQHYPVAEAEVSLAEKGDRLILKWPNLNVVHAYDVLTGRQVASYSVLSKFFREYKNWSAKLDGYLHGLLSARLASDDRTVRIRALGSGAGEELYSIAIVVDSVLRRLREDPLRWSVAIEGYDANPLAIEEARRGVYMESRSGLNRVRLAGYDPEFVFSTEDPYDRAALWSAREPYRSWVRVYTVDLTEVDVLFRLSDASTDVLFVRYLTMHLDEARARRIQNWMRSRVWGRQDSTLFLSYADPKIDETGPL